MFGLKIILPAAAATFVAVVGTSSVQAATVYCPASTDSDVTVGYEYTSDPSVVCLASGDDNPAENAFENSSAFPEGFNIVTKTDDSGFILSDWFLNVSDDGDDDLQSGTNGSFTFLGNSQYDDFVLLFKGGGNDLANWSAIRLPTTPLDIDWKIVDTGPGSRALSHVTIYGSPSPIPLPAAGWLLITALGGLGIAARRRRKAS